MKLSLDHCDLTQFYDSLVKYCIVQYDFHKRKNRYKQKRMQG